MLDYDFERNDEASFSRLVKKRSTVCKLYFARGEGTGRTVDELYRYFLETIETRNFSRDESGDLVEMQHISRGAANLGIRVRMVPLKSCVDVYKRGEGEGGSLF